MNIMRFLNEENIKKLEEQMDDEDIEEMIQAGIEQRVVPALEEIRERRRQDPDTDQIRENYRQLSDEKKQEVFDAAVMSIVEAAFVARQQPTQGVKQLRELVRDPYTMEALLLIFDNEDHIDPEYGEQMKDVASEIVTWVGVALAPELYEPSTVREVAERLGLEIDPDDVQ